MGAQVIDELEPQKGDYYIKKRTYDAFFGTDPDLLLRQKGVKEVLIVGTGTVSNICVLRTAERPVCRAIPWYGPRMPSPP